MKRYQPNDNEFEYYLKIFRWIDENIDVNTSRSLLRMLRDKYPYDKD